MVEALSAQLRIKRVPFTVDWQRKTLYFMDKLTGIHAFKEALEARRPIDRSPLQKEAGHASRRNRALAPAGGSGAVRGPRTALTGWPFERPRELWRWRRRARGDSGKTFWRMPMLARAMGLIVLLDGVEDPHNLGAIVRTTLAAARTAW